MAECSDRQYTCCSRQPIAWFVVWISRGRIKALPIFYTCEYTFISIIIIVIMSSICVDKLCGINGEYMQCMNSKRVLPYWSTIYSMCTCIFVLVHVTVGYLAQSLYYTNFLYHEGI